MGRQQAWALSNNYEITRRAENEAELVNSNPFTVMFIAPFSLALFSPDRSSALALGPLLSLH